LQAITARVPGADDGDGQGVVGAKLSTDVEDLRRISDLAEAGWIDLVAEGDDLDAVPRGEPEFDFNILERRDRAKVVEELWSKSVYLQQLPVGGTESGSR